MEEQSVNSIDGTFTYSQIVEITSSFKTLLGEGGFGKVYLGTLNDDTYVAVKVLFGKSSQDYKQFQAEVKLLKIVHHKNLVSLLGYCDEDDIKALVYEFVANGDLEKYLSEKSKIILSWKSRLQIAIDVANGLEYLHGHKPPIIHRDLKPPNILLTEDMQAKIADFGLSRTFTTESASHISTKLAGTFGYLDPESFKTGCVRKKSDIYSFGIILLELITGQPAVIKRDKDDIIHITNWIDPLIEKEDIWSIVDTRLKGEFNINVAKKAIEIAMSCVKPIIERPDMSCLQQELHKCLDIEMGPRVLGETNRLNNGMKSRNSTLVAKANQVEAEWIEQYEPGVYLTLVALQDGTRNLKRVRFSRRRFEEHQAEIWWSENREKVYEGYNVRGLTDPWSLDKLPDANRKESGSSQDGENGMKCRNSKLVAVANQDEAECIEKYSTASNLLSSLSASQEVANGKESGLSQDGENGMKSNISTLIAVANQDEAAWVEQYEPGVYVTIVALQNGTRHLKRIRFSRRRFTEGQAEIWFSKNGENVYKRYNIVRWSDNLSDSGQTA